MKTIAQQMNLSAHIAAGPAIAGGGMILKMAHEHGHPYTLQAEDAGEAIVPNSYDKDQNTNEIGTKRVEYAVFEDGSRAVVGVKYINRRTNQQ